MPSRAEPVTIRRAVQTALHARFQVAGAEQNRPLPYEYMNKRKRYTDDERSTAVLFLEAQGYPEQPGALRRASDYLKIPQSTLSRWARGIQNPPPSQLVSHKKASLIDMLRDEAYAILGDMQETRQDTDYRTLGTVLGIVIDKLQLLDGKPTERIENIGELSDVDRATRIAALLDAARTRRDGSTSDVEGLVH